MAFFANGRYDLMYLYKNLNEGNYCMGHLSSRDMLHWRMHPDALYPDSFDGGIFSGGAFVDDDGTVYVAYWALPKANDPSDKTAGIRIAMSSDGKNDYEKWQKFPEYAVRAGTEVGITEVTDEHGNIIDYLGCTDPSNIWKIDDTYYMQLGALVVLNKFRNDTNAPARMLGDWTEYYCSKDLHSWTHLGRFYHRNQIQGYDVKPIERAPLELGADEKLQLNIFIDRCVIEVFANERQAICRRSYTKLLPAYSVQLIGAKPENVDLTAWNIDETNLF